MHDLIIETREHDLGGGFKVGRVLPFRKRRMVGPFIFFDRMGPHTLPAPVPQHMDVRPHPHIGLSTVTYLFEGQMTHRDSLGVEQTILPGALNWMTAGSGISHSERFDGMRTQGGRIDGIQAWVAVPEANEEDTPDFAHYSADDLPSFSDTGMSGRMIAGSAYGVDSPAKTHSPLFYADITLEATASIALPDSHPERAAYIASGVIEFEGQRYQAGQMLVFSAGGAPVLKALNDSRLMLLGGEPLGARHIWWNFVSSRKERIEQAKADWMAGRIVLPEHDNGEFIPLPQTVA
ncbi:pirin family protein [Pollutimonas harenae]|uniref:Pirin family protein n=1 Tax=Pollutimonas harenae TaxID=657015 RepID=A0A853H1Y5_9BURK|nr:pirin family protein [Pollutimonas harenae]NYT86030.1 pirin family protein [Pollutimonas harenae]TEA71078.1 pirin family protein [Pollutimonas harenae]